MTETLVCFGDSITEGVIGAAYVDVLRERLPGMRVVNAGINGDTTVNLLRRLERDVVPHCPDRVILMVGLNDLATVYGEPLSKVYYRAVKRVDVELTPLRFAQTYRRLIAALQQRTGARLALCTLTTFSELPDHSSHPYIDAYCAVVRALALQGGLDLIDVRAAFQAAIAQEPRSGPTYHLWYPLLDALRIRLGRRQIDSIAAARGYRLLCDGVHLSSAGAAIVAASILDYLGVPGSRQ
ncbi:MAG: hypothetical protein OHK0022_38820 [Roseiflexaceae bacterium]